MNENIKEIWKNIPGCQGFYQASNLGRIRSIDRIACNGRKVIGRVLKPYTDKYGYYQNIVSIDGNSKVSPAHRFVALAFFPIDNPEKWVVNHKDGNKQNNKIDNLEWTTVIENCRHAHRTGLVNHTAENNPATKLKNSDIINIRNSWKPRVVTFKHLSQKYSVSISTIRNIVRNKSWKTIPINQKYEHWGKRKKNY